MAAMAPMMSAIGLDSVEMPPDEGVLATAVGPLLVTESLVDECEEVEVALVVVEFRRGVDMAVTVAMVDMLPVMLTLALPDALAETEPEALGSVPEPPVYWNWPE
jgi:hypothetical protein